MKKQLLLLFLAASAAISTYGESTVGSVFCSDFKKDFENGGTLSEGWSSKGVEGPVAESMTQYFGNYSATNAFSVLEFDSFYGAFTPSEFSVAEGSDQWLYTPEFEVTEDAMIISFDVAVVNSGDKNNFKLYISESAGAEDDYYEIMGSSVTGTEGKTVVSSRSFVLDGYKGEKIRLAFVSNGNHSGMMGFGEISVAPFYVGVENLEALKTVVIDDMHPGFTVYADIATPYKANSVTALLTTDDGYEYKAVTNGAFSQNIINATFNFPSIDMQGKTEVGYKIVFTPNYANAPSVEISGMLNYGVCTYPGVLVLEELTGTWCSWCPYGAGVLEYLQDTYNGGDKGLALGFAVHSGNVSVDPMEVPDLLNATQAAAKRLNFSGFPYMMINRSAGIHPAESLDYCRSTIAKGSYANVKIREVALSDDKSEMTVKYDGFLSFDAEGTGLNVLAYVTQNNMTGKGRTWKQANNLSSYTSQRIESELGADVVPYFEKFINGAENPVEMAFEDVARYVYPAYAGVRIEGAWKKDEAKEMSMTVPVLDYVTDLNEAEVAIIFTSAASGEVVAADRMSISGTNGVNEISDSLSAAAQVYMIDGKLYVETAADAVVEIYTTDGSCMMRQNVVNGLNTIDMPEISGIAIVRVIDGANVVTGKFAVK